MANLSPAFCLDTTWMDVPACHPSSLASGATGHVVTRKVAPPSPGVRTGVARVAGQIWVIVRVKDGPCSPDGVTSPLVIV